MDGTLRAKLESAGELARSGQVAKAVSVYEDIVDACVQQRDPLSAAAVAGEALLLLTKHPDRDAQTRLSCDWSRAYGMFRAVGLGFNVHEQARLMGAASTALSSGPPDAHGHRALCIRCGTLRGAAWLRCGGCGFLPELPDDVALGVLLSERVHSQAQLRSIGAAIREGGSPGVSRHLLRVFSALLFQLHNRRGVNAPAHAPLPGTVAAMVSPDQRTGVIVDVTRTSDGSERNRTFDTLVGAACRALLASTDERDIEDLSDPIQSCSLRHLRNEAERRLGEHIRFERWQRLCVDHGLIGVFQVKRASPASVRPSVVRSAGNLIAALVAVETAAAPTEHPEVADLAHQLAQHAAMVPLVAGNEQTQADGEDSPFVCQPWALDPTLSVSEAIAIAKGAIGIEVSVGAFVRYVRGTAPDDGPWTFPGEAAMRA